MALVAQCPECRHSYSIDEARLGRRARCRKCGGEFTLTAAEAPDRRHEASETTQPSRESARRPPRVPAGAPSSRRAASTLGAAAQFATVDEQGGANRPDSLPAEKPVEPVAIIAKLSRFEIREELGAGAFGKVYRAFDPQLAREVALKVPQAAALESPRAVDRFLREARAAAQLRHPHIVPVYDAGRDGAHYYIASAFIEGRTLEAAIEERESAGRRFDFREAAAIVSKLADALDYAHSLGIVHRDVKPANVMLDSRGEPHLMDFGLARVEASQERLTHDGALLGTPAYMSPEQAGGDQAEVGAASDQYSLGVVLYELLTGQTPFSGPPAVVVANILSQPVPGPRAMNGEIPRDLETICVKALTNEAMGRYADCGQLGADLRRWLADEPIRARRMHAVERFWRWCRRNPTVAGLTTLLAVVLIAATLISWSYAAFAVQQRKRADANAATATEHVKMARDSQAIAERERLRADEKAAEAAQKATEALEHLRKAQESESLAQRHAAEAEANLRAAEEQRSLASGRAAEIEQRAYFERVRLAYEHIVNHSGNEAAAILDSCPESLRGWEWHYCRRLCTPAVSIELDPNSVPPVYPAGVAFSPDGTLLFAGGQGVTAWDAATGAERRSITKDPTYSLALSPTGSELAFVKRSHGGVHLWHLQSDRLRALRRKGSGNLLSCLAMSPDGAHIAFISGFDTAEVWRTANGTKVGALTQPEIREGTDAVPLSRSMRALAWSSDGKWIATGANGGQVTVWDASSGRVISELPVPTQAVTCLTFSADSRTLYVGTLEGAVIFSSMPGGIELGRLPPHRGSLLCMALSPDGVHLAVGTYDLTIWNVAVRQQVAQYRGELSAVNSVAFDPDGRRVAALGPAHNVIGALEVWPVAGDLSIAVEETAADEAIDFSFSRDGQRLVVYSSKAGVRVLNLERGRMNPIGDQDGELPQDLQQEKETSSRGRRVYLDRGAIVLADAPSRIEILRIERTGKIDDVAFSPDGRRIVYSSQRCVGILDAGVNFQP